MCIYALIDCLSEHDVLSFKNSQEYRLNFII